MSRFIQVAGALACLAITIGLYSFATAQPPASPAEEKIRAALEGDLPSSRTGDGVLDDILGVIKGRGSILEGSSLDPAADVQPTQRPSRNAYVAEQLLKASRLLESVESPSDSGTSAADRTALVMRMRAEAVKLLSD